MPVTKLREGEAEVQNSPFFLPDGRHFLYSASTGPNTHVVFFASLDGGDPVRLVEMALLALVSAAGYAFEMASHEYLPLFYKATMQLGLFLVFWLVFEYIRLSQPDSRSRSFPGPPAPTTGGG